MHSTGEQTMPREGYSVITVKNATKAKLDKIAEKHGESVPETIEYLLKNCKQEA
jgi:hypothetical protein